MTEGRATWKELEGYRGLLAIAIVFFHANQHSRDANGNFVYQGSWENLVLNNLDSAVAGFFVLSGFLVFRAFAMPSLVSPVRR